MRLQSRREVIQRFVGARSALQRSPLRPEAKEQRPQKFSTSELVDDGQRFFGTVSRGLAEVVEEATRRWGQPNAYILGQEASGAFVAGARYGEGVMYTRNAGDMKVYWQGPSLGFDAGADGDRTMMLVYNLPATQAVFRRFGGIERLGLSRRRLRLYGLGRATAS